ncbi:MAG: hypothetical protein ING77_12925 [Rhodocyclaceae bacterium]|nr:hypothetical protein [Rhodocyclaceae bacterium]
MRYTLIGLMGWPLMLALQPFIGGWAILVALVVIPAAWLIAWRCEFGRWSFFQ